MNLGDKLLSEMERFRSPRGYFHAGYPYFDTFFGRDGLIVGWQMLWIDPSIAKAALYWAAQYQATTFNNKADCQPGKILHVLDGDTPNQQFPYFGSVDSTPLFVIVADAYFRVTHDKKFIISIWGNIVRAVNWLLMHGDTDFDSFIEYKKINPYGNFHQGWKDCREDHLKIAQPVAIVEAQGYAYSAYLSAVHLSGQVDKGKPFVSLWLKKAEKLREEFHKHFWWEKESCYYLALDGSKRPKESVVSNFGHLFFTGIIPDEVLGRVVKRIFEPDLFTPYGIRTLSEEDPDFDPFSYHLGSIWPHDNWIIREGLKKLGLAEEADRIKRAILLAYHELGDMHELFRVEHGQIFSLTDGEYVHHPGSEPGPANTYQAWAICGLAAMVFEKE